MYICINTCNMKFLVNLIFCYVFFTTICFGQEQEVWKGYFSFKNIKSIAQSETTAFIAAENTYIKHDVSLFNQEIVSSIQGLKSQTIVAVLHSDIFDKTIIANANGLLIIVDENNKNILNVVDILNKSSVPVLLKKINNLTENNGILYIATDFGICEFDLQNNVFKDTFIIGSSGAQIGVNKVLVFDDVIYALTKTEGLKTARLDNPSLVDFAEWRTIDPEIYSNGCVFDNQLLLVKNAGGIFSRSQSGNVRSVINTSNVLNIKPQQNNYLVVTTPNDVTLYNNLFQQVARVNSIPNVTSSFTDAVLVKDALVVGTASDGVYQLDRNQLSTIENITPNGPDKNNIFRIKKFNNYLWAVYGNYNIEYNPYPLVYEGINYFSQEKGWELLKKENLLNTRSIVQPLPHPTKLKEIYFASFNDGLLKLTMPEEFQLFDNQTVRQNGPESITNDGDNIRINSLAFDTDHNLWMTNSRSKNLLKVMKKDGNWVSYNFENLISDYVSENGTDMVIDRNGTKWIATFKNGVLAFNEKYNNKFKRFTSTIDEGDLPIAHITSLALDNRNQLWIGTYKGLRVINSVDRFINDNAMTPTSIIIMEDGLAQELFYEQTITDIKVDGSNNKWVAIAEAGVFQISPDGQQTLKRFTKDNSPLPSNNVNCIDIDPVTGEVFFATSQGLVSFKGTATAAASDLSKVYVYPNPVRPGFNGDVKISGLLDKSIVKITDIEGNLVYETTAEGGTVLWNTTAFGRHKVASGVYMIFISSKDASETMVKKVMIVR